MISIPKLSTALVVLGNAILAAVIGLGDFTWSDPQKGVCFVVVNTTVALGVSVYAHFRPATAKEPVALGTTFTIWTQSVFTIFVAFDIWHLTVAKVALMQTVIVSAVGLAALFLVRDAVTPVADAEQQIAAARSAALRRPPDGHAQ